MQNDELDPEKIMEDYVRNRGDIFEEWHFMVRHVPLTIVRLHDISGYILKHENKTTPDQELSFVFRELIALCQLSAKGEPRFAANHVRRLYRAGITNTVIFEAAEAFSTSSGTPTSRWWRSRSCSPTILPIPSASCRRAASRRA